MFAVVAIKKLHTKKLLLFYLTFCSGTAKITAATPLIYIDVSGVLLFIEEETEPKVFSGVFKF